MLRQNKLKKISKILVFVFIINSILYSFPNIFLNRTSAETRTIENNIALGKKVEVSGLEGASWTGDKAVDGNYTDDDSRWSSAEVTDSSSQWLYVDLEKEHSIEKVNIRWQNWAYGTEFKIQKSSDKTNWEDITTITNPVGKEESNKNLINTIPLNDVYTRYIRILISKRNQWTSVSIREFEVIGYELKEGNVAEGKSASASAVENNSSIWSADKVIDGDKESDDSRWASPTMNVVPTEQDKHWIVINFNNEVEIDRVNIYWYKKAFAENYIIQISNDGQTWEDIKNITHSASHELNKVDEINFDTTKKAKYLRIFITERNENAYNNVSIREIEVMGREKIISEINLTCEQVINSIESLPAISINDTSVSLPEVPKGFGIRVKGTEFENIIDKQGNITKYNINDVKVSIILEVYKENDESNNATKNVDLIVPGKTSLHPEIFKNVNNPNPEPTVIPRLQEWYGLTGSFTLSNSARIILNDTNNIDLNKVAKLFNDDLNDFVGFKLEVVYGKEKDVKPGDIYIESIKEDIYNLGKEGYFTTINDSIKIKAPTYTGSLYGTITLLQILWQDGQHNNIPSGVIRDYPKYEIRGLMLDVARMPMSLEFVNDYAKILSWYKMNEFHLHLNDNQWAEGNYNNPDSWDNVYDAFRLESKNHPGLKPNNNDLNDPYYTQEEYRSLESIANDYGIEVVPEIDTPAHSLTFTQYMKEKGTPIHSNKYWFDHIDIDNTLGKELIKGLLDEFIDGEDPVFSGKTVHIGIDEYDTGVGDKFRQYASDLANHVIAKGKTPRVWGSLKPYSGTTILPEGTIIDVWNTSWEDPVARIKEGYDIVNVPQPYTYITPSRWHKDFMDTQNIYNNWEPNVFEGVTLPKAESQLLGGKMAIWGDESMEGIVEADLHERLLPAVATLSEKTWSGTKSDKDYLKFMKTFNSLGEGPNTTVARDVESKNELVVKYDFENNNAIDSSLNKYNGTIENGEFLNGENGKALKFNGETTLKTSLRAISYPYTASFDVKIDEMGKEINLFSGVDGELKVKEDGTIAIRRSFYNQSFNYKLEKGKWSNVTIIGTFQALSLYVDGQFVEQLYSYRAHNNSIISGQNLHTTFVLPLEKIGENLKGEMDNIEIYNTAMTDEWIAGDNTYRLNLACGTDAYSSSNAYLYTKEWRAIDGNAINADSKWVSSNSDNQWLLVDLKDIKNISEVEILFEKSPSEYKILTSMDGVDFEEVGHVNNNIEVKNNIIFNMKEARYVKFQGIRRGNNSGYSIIELKVLGEESKNEDDTSTIEVDKTLLELVIGYAKDAKEEGALENVVPAVVNEFEEALEEAKAVLADKDATEVQVDLAVNRLINAIHMLEFKKGDKEELIKLVEIINALDESKYTASTWATLQDELSKANAVIADENAMEEEVVKAYEDLNKAFSNLELEASADKTKLQQLVSELEGKDTSKYTKGTVDKFNSELVNSKAVLDNKEATQEQINEAYNNLIKAYLDLRLIPDKSILKDLINKAESMDLSNYTKESVNKFNLQLANGKAVLNNKEAIQKEIDEAAKGIELAKASLELKVIPDKSILKDLINKAESMDLSNYTKESVNKFNLQLANLKAVLNKEEATQEEVDKAAKGLELALNDLEVKQNNNDNGNNGNSGNVDTDKDDNKDKDVDKENELPKTGGSSSTLIGLFGTMSTLIGVAMIRRQKNK